MLQSGLLKVNIAPFLSLNQIALDQHFFQTSECIALDLLTCEDLESLRPPRVEGNATSSVTNGSSNRRYLILTYTAEFDRIHYPLPLEYTGLPDATILQATIRKLQAEIEKLRNTESTRELQKRIDQLTTVNRRLIEENHRLSNGIAGKDLKRLLGSVKSLESTVAKERMSFRIQIQTLRSENAALTLKIRQLTEPGKRKPGDGGPVLKRQNSLLSLHTIVSNRRKSRSRSPSVCKNPKVGGLSPGIKDGEICICRIRFTLHMVQK
ncbi:hypothetical protein KM043_000555 [Ampulex compressa]|nr:hypothetical protein KM043_000555 [Ampulex compressa]